MRVERFLQVSARHFPDKTALVAGGRRLSFGDLDALSDRLAATLVQRGLVRGERVVVFMDNCWEAVVGMFAVLKAGGVFSPINPSTKADKLAYVINNCRASAILTQQRVMPVVDQALAECPSVTFVAGGGAAASSLCAWTSAALTAGVAAAGVRRHRHRPRHAHLHLGLDRLSPRA